MVILELFSRWKFWTNTDRIGPDIAGTHYKLFFKKAGRKLCKKNITVMIEPIDFIGAIAASCIINDKL